MFVIEKPLPAVTEDGAPYWEACRAGELRVGMPVEVVFDKVSDEVTLPRFRPRR